MGLRGELEVSTLPDAVGVRWLTDEPVPSIGEPGQDGLTEEQDADAALVPSETGSAPEAWFGWALRTGSDSCATGGAWVLLLGGGKAQSSTRGSAQGWTLDSPRT